MNKEILGSQNPETEFSRLRLASIDSSVNSVTHGSETGRDALLLDIDEVPAQGMTYLRLMRDLKIQEMLVAYLLEQHEQARIEELRNTPTLEVIEPPVEGTKRVWPRRGFMVTIAFLGTFVFASAIALLVEMLTLAVDNPEHPQHVHVQNIRQSWKRGE
jgi:hypothetical protein